MTFKKSLASLIVAAVATGASASQSLMETYEKAVANDPTLAIAQMNAQKGNEDVKAGFASLLPTVNASARYTIPSVSDSDETIEPDFDNPVISGGISVQQNIFTLAAFSAYDAVKAYASASEINATIEAQSLMVRTANDYINVLRAQDGLAVAEAQLTAVERQYEQTKQRFEVGLATDIDKSEAGATLDQTRVAVIRAQAQYDIALQSLVNLTGEVPDSVFAISEDLPIQAPKESGQQEWVEFASKNHPSIKAAEMQLDGAQLTYKARKENRLPSLTGSFNFDYTDVDAIDNDLESNWSASYTVQIAMPIYTGGDMSATIAKAGIDANIQEQNLELMRRAKRVEVGNYYRIVRADAQNVEAQEQALASREAALNATQVGYDVGIRNIVEVLNAQTAVFTAQNDLNNARYDYIMNLLRLKQATGNISLADLESIEDYMVKN